MTEIQKLSKQEILKKESHFLKGDIAADLADTSSDQVTPETYELLKFHGSYFGYDRDTATARKQAGLEKEYEFMVRLKCPGGVLSAEQYLGLDELAEKYANGTLRITTRETFQFHCVKKASMKPFIADVNRLLLSTLGGCGDIVRNVMTCPAPIKDAIHAKLMEDCFTLAKLCAPKTTAYCEVWLDGQVIADYPFNPEPGRETNPEPLYGTTYMPRKFKIGIARPEDNCIDVLTHDLAILALFEGQELIGYNFALGGGLGMHHNQPKTYPRLATPIMFVPPYLLTSAAEAVIKLQRDHGDRTNRKHARLKYLVEEKGVDWIKETLEGYLLQTMEPPRPMKPYAVKDYMGWHEQGDGKWFLGLPISSGRIMDRDGEATRSGLRDVIEEYGMEIRLTADQNILLCEINEGDKISIEHKLTRSGVKLKHDVTPAYRNTLACVAYPTCGKALAEAERIKLPLVGEIEQVLDRYGMLDERITIRIAGCANGCSRPYVGDISIVGRIPDHYTLYIGGDFEGTRLGKELFDRVPLAHVAEAFAPIIALWSKYRIDGEGFGDFCYRYGVDKAKQQAVEALSEYSWAK
ncbi:MAG: NADPH-dependent assimilatory sulfite reductase hemoprotein subunit [Rickettsiales bacterium]